ncbi:unnamed protein product [Durusdinium trenchii]|uniref:Uncharacterized protein n=2 Tax=Durusdinium trenchii TaxID=1381693 RepID=A0ABP0LJR1_9DINO
MAHAHESLESLPPARRTAAVLALPGNTSCFDCDMSCSMDPWVSLSHSSVICITCAGQHRSFGVHISYVRSMKLDTLKDSEWRLLLKGGNDAFQAFLADTQSVSRKVWLSLPMETRYHTPAADLYRRRLQAMTDGNDLPEELRPVKPPAPKIVESKKEPKWTDSDRCQLCKANFWLLMRKHHCRKCGRCICAACSPMEGWRPLPAMGHPEACRHCKVCVPPVARAIVGLG